MGGFGGRRAPRLESSLYFRTIKKRKKKEKIDSVDICD